MPGKAIIEAAGLTDVGLKRTHNEDSFLLADLGTGRLAREAIVTGFDRPSGGLLVVADGMGGAAAGEVASRMAVDTMRTQLGERIGGARKVLDLARLLTEVAREANKEIFAKSKSDKDLRGMGTTLTATLAVGDLLLVSQVGDSRAYVLRKGELTQVTRDQSLVGQMIYEGKMSVEDARAKLPKNVILQAVGKKETLEPVLTALELRNDDRMLLCSDGLSNLVKDEELRELVGAVSDPARACQVLVDLAKKRGGDDNITAVIAKFSGDALRPADDGMIPFYEDILTERGERSIFQSAAEAPVAAPAALEGEDVGDRTIVKTPARTARLPPPPPEALAPPPPKAPFAFDVDEVLGGAPMSAATLPPPPAGAPLTEPPPESLASPAAGGAKPASTDAFLEDAAVVALETEPPPARIPRPSLHDDTTEPILRHAGARNEASLPTMKVPTSISEGTEKYPLSKFTSRAKPETPPALPSLDETLKVPPKMEEVDLPRPAAIANGRFLHKPAGDDAPWGAPEVATEPGAIAQTDALRRVRASLDDSGMFKHGDTGAHRRGSGSRLGPALMALGIGGIVVAGGLILLTRGSGERASPASHEGSKSAPPAEAAPPAEPIGTVPPEAETSATQAPVEVPTPPTAAAETPPPTKAAPPGETTAALPAPPRKPPPSKAAVVTPAPSPPETKKPPKDPKRGAPEPPPLPKTGSLTIHTQPAGAYIKVNGELKGASPKEIEVPTGEPQNLLVYKVGFEDHHLPGYVLTKARDEISVTLKRKSP